MSTGPEHRTEPHEERAQHRTEGTAERVGGDKRSSEKAHAGANGRQADPRCANPPSAARDEGTRYRTQ